MLTLTPLIRFFSNSLFILSVIYFAFIFFIYKYGKNFGDYAVIRELGLSFESFFLFFGFSLWLFNFPINWYELPPFLLFLLAMSISPRLNTLKKLPLFLTGLIISILIGFLVVIALENTYSTSFSLHLLLPNISISGYSYETIVFSVIFFLAGFLWMNYAHFLASYFVNIQNLVLKTRSLVLSHLQLIPMFLFPLFVAHSWGRADLYEPIISNLFKFSLAFLYLIPYCMILALIGKRIVKLKAFWIGISIWSIFSVFNAFSIIFEFIIASKTTGSFELGIIISYLTCCSVGIILARKINCPISTIFRTGIKTILKDIQSKIR